MDSEKKAKCRFYLTEFEDVSLGATLGMDMRVTDDSVDLAEWLTELEAFAAAHLADCRGCDACCQERAPLIAADIAALSALLPHTDFPAHSVCAAFGVLSVDENGVADIILKRDSGNACIFLDSEQRCCKQHGARPFVCRSHYCLPRSQQIEQLRETVVNDGENELLRLLLLEEERGAPPLECGPLADRLDIADLANNAQQGCAAYGDIRLREALGPALWRQIGGG